MDSRSGEQASIQIGKIGEITGLGNGYRRNQRRWDVCGS